MIWVGAGTPTAPNAAPSREAMNASWSALLSHTSLTTQPAAVGPPAWLRRQGAGPAHSTVVQGAPLSTPTNRTTGRRSHRTKRRRLSGYFRRTVNAYVALAGPDAAPVAVTVTV